MRFVQRETGELIENPLHERGRAKQTEPQSRQEKGTTPTLAVPSEGQKDENQGDTEREDFDHTDVGDEN